MRVHGNRFVALLGALVLVSACTAMSPPDEPVTLDGRAWVLAQLTGHRLVPNSTVTLRFDQGRVSGTDGCNRYSLPYSTDGTALTIQRVGISTQMACPPDLTQQAEAYIENLTAASSYRLSGEDLEILGVDGKTLARFAPQPQGLAGTSWHVTGYNNGKQAVVSVTVGSNVTMAFGTDGRVSGSAGCNNYTASYTNDGAALKFGPAAATRRMCVTPEGVMEQEQQFLQALETVTTARQEGERLELRGDRGQLVVSLQAQPTQ